MPGNYVSLKKFNAAELIFDDNETREILKFIFKGYVGDTQTNSMRVTDTVRGFAQGLLVEAIDSSYAIGYIEAIFMASVNPAAGTTKILKKFGKKAVRHWFKHATEKDLLNAKIYEIVRKALARNFATDMLMMISGQAKAGKQNIALIDYNSAGVTA
ncbi:MAG: hypothetical protein L0Z73_14580 [Gammaproteobacteria bacterium]|nr:hypothetical protein [Gammaproteobacteria bacterium]